MTDEKTKIDNIEERIDDPVIGGTAEDYAADDELLNAQEIIDNLRNEKNQKDITQILKKQLEEMNKVKPIDLMKKIDVLKEISKEDVSNMMIMGMFEEFNKKHIAKKEDKREKIVKYSGLAGITELMIKQNELFYDKITNLIRFYEEREILRKDRLNGLIEKGFDILKAVIPQLSMLSQIAKNNVTMQRAEAKKEEGHPE